MLVAEIEENQMKFVVEREGDTLIDGKIKQRKGEEMRRIILIAGIAQRK